MRPPKKWKMALVIWIAIYPVITLIFLFFGKHLIAIEPLPLRTLCITILAVPVMVFAALPLVQKLFKSWLYK
jgi:antibiotic biosynthesis monooxygenase (ABM) superfamily enzyme